MRDDRNGRKGGDRMSWREVDKIRDKSEQRDRDPMQKQSSPAALAAQKSYRAALERAFASGKLEELARSLQPPSASAASPAPGAHAPTAPSSMAAPPRDGIPSSETAALPAAPPPAPRDPERENRLKMLAKIREAEGRDPISRAVDAFLAKYPRLPDDYEALTKVLAHRDDDRVRATLEQLAGMIAKEKPRRGRTLAAQLRFLEDTHSDPDIRKHAAEVRAKL